MLRLSSTLRHFLQLAQWEEGVAAGVRPRVLAKEEAWIV